MEARASSPARFLKEFPKLKTLKEARAGTPAPPLAFSKARRAAVRRERDLAELPRPVESRDRTLVFGTQKRRSSAIPPILRVGHRPVSSAFQTDGCRVL